MFDKLIESEPEGAEFRNRRTYFMMTSLGVSVLIAMAVVVSIFAADIGLGSSDFKLTEMLAPVEMEATELEPPKPATPATASQAESLLSTRQASVARIDESPIAPTTTSVVANHQMSRPIGGYTLGPVDTNPGNPGTSGREPSSVATDGGLSKPSTVAENDILPEPPPAARPKPANPPTKSLGVINGQATYLPKPIYSAAATAVRAQGKVDVQVMIDEKGNVISAKAVSGHILLRPSAEQAARNARFTATYLSNVPVKVTGVIVYNFTR